MSLSCIQQCTICFVNLDGNNGYIRHIRQVHGNDRQFATFCSLCHSKFVFTNLKSFISHFRKHMLDFSFNEEALSSLCTTHDTVNLNIHDDIEEHLTVYEYEQYDQLEEIKKFYVKMLLKIREGHVLPGSVMKTIALSVSSLIETFSIHLLCKLNINVDHPISRNINDDIEKILFEISKNEDSFISSCELYFKFIKPKEIQLPTGNKAYYIPIRDVLMNLFKKKDFYDCIKKEKQYISQFDGQDILYHYRNAEIGRQHLILNVKENSLLLQLYCDDIGIVNPLMGKNTTHKLTTFYFSIDDLPACHNSSLNFIHLLLLFYTKDFEDENNRRILFNQLNKDLRCLEDDGLVLPRDINSTYFTISTVCADNLAGSFSNKVVIKKRIDSHELGGFTCAFNSGRCCRYCLIYHRDMKHVYKESDSLMRTAASHDSHAKHIHNVSNDKSLYGVNEKSVLSTLPSFNPITCLPPDIMHDILEGIMPKFTNCLLHTIVSNRLCTSSQICHRINNFIYGINDRRNRPPAFKEKEILDKRVPSKTMEKYCLFLNLSFILIDIIDKILYWFLYKLLRQIWDILYSDYPRKSWFSTLEQLIQEFIQLFQTIFPGQFIPKCHFLLHAARNTAKNGPLKRQMNLRYESKHHLLKKIANRCNNFINLPRTISRRAQLRQCYDLMDDKCLKSGGISGRFRSR
ncbi:unnamed protein product [Rotaria sp. Silwood2]|nr:unnamed protein product [Rotaria sp. Silwood2]